MPKKVSAADRDRGRRYKAAREAAKLTQTQAGAMLGKNQMTVSRWERGVGKPQDSERVATLYNTNAAWLDYGYGEPAGSDPPYAIWPVFADKIAKAQIDPWQMAILRSVRFPLGVKPELETYDRFLFGLQSVTVEEIPDEPEGNDSETN